MQSVLKAMLGQVTGDSIGKMAAQTGADEGKTQELVQLALPLMLGALNKNASKPDGAQALNKALENHDGGILSDVVGAVQDQAVQQDGANILGHMFNGNQEKMADGLSQKTGLDTATVLKILAMVAPLVLAYLGKKKSSDGLDAGALAGMLSSEASDGGIMDNPLVKGLLDKDGDGSVIDDVMGMLGKK